MYSATEKLLIQSRSLGFRPDAKKFAFAHFGHVNKAQHFSSSFSLSFYQNYYFKKCYSVTKRHGP